MSGKPNRARAPSAFGWLTGGGEMGKLIREMDWSKTPVGPIESWPQSLRTAVSICLNSKFPMVIWWGPEQILIFNDAWRPVLGEKHPRALGSPGRKIWPEIWDVIGPMFESVMATGHATWSDDGLLLINRYGYIEEAYYTWSYSPIHDESGNIGGIFTAVTETTARVVGERRMQTLRDLAAYGTQAKEIKEACRLTAEAIAANPLDIPFALLYLIDESNRAHLVSAAGVEPETEVSPRVIDLRDEVAGITSWPLVEVARTAKAKVVKDLGEKFGYLPDQPWQERPREAVVIPIMLPGHELPYLLLALAVSPRRAFDDEYRNFFSLVATQVEAVIANVVAYEQERKRAETLAELDRAKTVFFSNASHELRTPLTLMLGPLEDTLAEDGLAPQTRERLEIACRNSLRLLKLINTLLDFSSSEAGRLQAVYEPVDLAALTADLASVFRSAIERAGMKLIIDCPPLAEAVYVDREMWEKIVLNFISNAFKYTFEGEIEVSLKSAGKSVELTVRDTGTGIPAEELPHVFERFHRVKGASGRSYEGSGIGLALVRELLKLHGGTVRVESELGRGSRFIVSIPQGHAHLPPNCIRKARSLTSTGMRGEAYIEEALRWMPEMRDADFGIQDEERAVSHTLETDAVQNIPHPAFRVPRSRILFADDNADMRDYVRRLLAANHEVEAVADGEAALEAARRRPPDLILTDVMMPKLDGVGLLRELRADEELKTIPVILLSARAGEGSRVEGMETGADDYLIKPFSARELLARVEAHLKLHRLRCEAERTIRESEERFRNMADNAPVMVWVSDPDASRTYLSKSWYEFTGQTPETALGFGWLDATHPGDREYVERTVLAANAKRESFRLEYRLPRKDGEYRWAIDSGKPHFDHGGEFLGYIGSIIDITDRKQAEEQIAWLLAEEQEARNIAEQATRAKDEFLAVVSHELRSPLNAILGWNHLLRAQQGDDPQVARVTEIIERSGKAQLQLIEDLLDTARIISGKMNLETQPVELVAVIASALDTVRPAADSKGIVIVRDFGPEADQTSFQITGDPDRLQQVVWNLVSNAIKFTPEGGRIWAKLRRSGSGVKIIVQDTGQGISPDLLPYIFDRFKQGDSSVSRRFGGLGLGLALVKHLVELHGGHVAVESPGEGRGSTFTISLPVRAIKGESGEESGTKIQRVGETTVDRRASRRLQTAKLEGVRALVVEDEDAARELITLTLEHYGALVTGADSAAAALAALESRLEDRAVRAPFDVLISDIGMPGADGYELIQRVRAHADERVSRIRAIALTAYARTEDRLRALQAGFHMHVPKPVDEAELTTVIVALIDRTPSHG